MKKWVMSRRDSAGKVEEIEKVLRRPLELSKSAQAECVEPAPGVVFVTLGEMTFVQAEGKSFPYLGSQAALALVPSATVDEGAIRFVLNGADIMRPGIRKMDDWGEAGGLVVVREEKKGRAISVGTTTLSGKEAQEMKKGSCIKNLHHVGDRYWELHKVL